MTEPALPAHGLNRMSADLRGEHRDRRLSEPVPVYEDWRRRRVYCPLMERLIDEAQEEGWRIAGFRRSVRYWPLVDGQPAGPLMRQADALHHANHVAGGHWEPRDPVVPDGADVEAGWMRFCLVRNEGRGGARDVVAMAEHPQDLLAAAARFGGHGVGIIDKHPFEVEPDWDWHDVRDLDFSF